MTIDEYINHIKDVLLRMEKMSADIPLLSDGKQAFKSIGIQLNFILSHAESGKSFKQGLLERQRYEVKSVFNSYPSKDQELINALKVIYTDLDAHDYNVGTIDREMSDYYFNFINERKSFHEELSNDGVEGDEHNLSYCLADSLYSDLFFANYYQLWLKHGIKNLQYFFLTNLFSFVAQLLTAIEWIPQPDDMKFVNDIERIAKFYETDEAEGTHMYLHPVEIKEIDGKPHLVDLKGTIVAYPQQ